MVVLVVGSDKIVREERLADSDRTRESHMYTSGGCGPDSALATTRPATPDSRSSQKVQGSTHACSP